MGSNNEMVSTDNFLRHRIVLEKDLYVDQKVAGSQIKAQRVK